MHSNFRFRIMSRAAECKTDWRVFVAVVFIWYNTAEKMGQTDRRTPGRCITLTVRRGQRNYSDSVHEVVVDEVRTGYSGVIISIRRLVDEIVVTLANRKTSFHNAFHDFRCIRMIRRSLAGRLQPLTFYSLRKLIPQPWFGCLAVS